MDWAKLNLSKRRLSYFFFDILPQRIILRHKEWQKSYNIPQEREGQNIKFIQGTPDDEDEFVTDLSATHLVIFDDMLGDKDEDKSKLWSTSHHSMLGHHRPARETLLYGVSVAGR